MEELLETLRKIGLPDAEIAHVQGYFDGDIDGLTEYVLYMRAELDDRHEYLS